jgi:LuxR family transcriptional regulator, maltose regulon positive regulatory protein
VLLAQDKCDQVLKLLKRLRERAQARGRSDGEIVILTLQALALQEKGERERAVSTLTHALTLAEPEGYVRTFVDEGPEIAPLVSEVLKAHQWRHLERPDHPSAHYLRKLLAALEQDISGSVAPTPELLEPLSERELEVLELIEAGKSNHRISQELFVTAGTVKTHIRNIYRKLDAHSRTQALVRARELNLL